MREYVREVGYYEPMRTDCQLHLVALTTKLHSTLNKRRGRGEVSLSHKLRRTHTHSHHISLLLEQRLKHFLMKERITLFFFFFAYFPFLDSVHFDEVTLFHFIYNIYKQIEKYKSTLLYIWEVGGWKGGADNNDGGQATTECVRVSVPGLRVSRWVK